MIKNKKNLITACTALFLTASVALINVSAAMTAPSQPLVTDDGVIKCAGTGATGVMIEMLGGNLVGAASVHLSTNNMPLFMPVFGTANNEIPDPWLNNAYYNTVANTKVNNASSLAYVAVNGPGSLDTSTIIDGTIPIFVNRPDFIIGTETELSAYISAIDSSESYKPYYGTGAGMATPEQIMATISSYAKGMQEVIDNSKGKLKGRYGNPAEIGTNFCSFYKSTMDYCSKKVAELNAKKVKTITVTGVSNNEWTVQDGGAADIFNEYIIKAGGIPIGQTDTIMTTAELLEADVLLASTSALKISIAAAFDNSGYKSDEIPDIYQIPKGVYGWNLRSPEGALATPWLTSVLYPQLAALPEINPVFTTAYFYSTFYHYTGNLEEIIGVVLNENTLSDGLSVDLSSWDSSIIPGVAQNTALVKPVIAPSDTGGSNSASTKDTAASPSIADSKGSKATNPATGNASTMPLFAVIIASASVILLSRKRK